MLIAGLFLGGVLFLAGATRGRGSGWGSAGVVTGLLGTAGTAMIAMHALITAALAQTETGPAAATMDALDSLGGWLILPLMTAQSLAITLFGLALWRSGTVHWWVPAATALVVVVALLPSAWSGPVSLGLALAAMGYACAAIVRRRAATGWAEVPTPAHRVWAGAACAVALLVLSVAKEVLFPGADDPDSAMTAAGSSPVPFVTEGLMALGIAVLFGGAAAFFAGAVRERGSGLAIAGTVLGCAGAVSIAAMGVLDFLTAALGASHAGSAVFGPLGAILFPAFMPLFLVENLMMVAFAAALWRAGTVSWAPLVLAAAFAVVGQIHPTGLVAVGQMLVGLVAVAWLAYGVLRAQGALAGVVRGRRASGIRTTTPAPTGGALG
ncbi:hypothetical protein GCM10027449_07630 [Sinomonas notoginsengisoli]|uniref:hypothetical protein n=1 Tax=Sinomonas notoginsengisoli TaxID=1457311 RepID=UPI001F329443|nr:hypothetical protein [Sinomonas notoginsengisoli]